MGLKSVWKKVSSQASCSIMWIVFLACLCLVSSAGLAGEEDDTSSVRLGRNVFVEKEQIVETAVAIGGDVEVQGRVRGSVVAVGGSVFLGSGAVVNGDVISLGGTVIKESGARVDGKVTVLRTSDLSGIGGLFPWEDMPHMPRMWRGFSLVSFLGYLTLAILVVLLIPATVGYVSFQVEFNTVKVFAWGILGIVLILPVALVLAVSILGIVLIPVEMILVASAFLLGSIAVAQLIGKKITIALKKPGRSIVLETAIGTAVLWVIGLVPVFGWLVKILVVLFGFGGVIFGIISHRRHA
ncbi:MAG: polymer-forming cytoskeletal protein [Desulfomonilia bacterium]|nr:polymer-forming cytoskeletal protein [Desulfomonilia bacterium]